MESGMRFSEIGQQLRAFRMESGLRAGEIAAKLGVSRAALYRYEKGDVIKLDTVNRLAGLLQVSPLSLLGIGVEYYSRAPGFFERIRQIEESADQVLQAFGSVCYLTTSETFDAALADSLHESLRGPGGDIAGARTTVDQVLALLASRKQVYLNRRPGIIAMVSVPAVRSFLEQGILAGATLPTTMRLRNRALAATEMERIAMLMETEPMGLQFGLLANAEPSSGFMILRGRERATLAINPFPPDAAPSGHPGVSMVTGADEAVAAHQRLAEAMWRDALRGPAAAARVRDLIAAAS